MKPNEKPHIPDANLKAVITAEDKASKVIEGVSGSLENVQTKLKSMEPAFKRMAAVGTVAFGAISAVVYKSVQAANEAALVQEQLKTVLQSTHGAAGLYIEDLNDQAQALQKLTTYSDEAINSAQALLLTFTNVKGAVFQEATSVILDMSTALGQDLKSSAIQLGKALNDPIQGINALRRVGVSFSDDQKKVIETLVKTGHTVEAQRLILKELNLEFGGSAAAAANTFAGRMAQLKVRLEDIGEVIGKALIPVFEKMLAKIVPIVERIIEWSDAHPELVIRILAVSAAVSALLAALGGLGLALPGIITTLSAFGALLTFLATTPIGLVITAIGLLAAGFTVLYSKSEGLIDAIQKVKDKITDLTNAFNDHVIQSAIVQNILTALIASYNQVRDAVVNNLWPALQQLWTTIKEELWPALLELWEALKPLAPYFEFVAKVVGAILVVALLILVEALKTIILWITNLLTWWAKLTAWVISEGTPVIKAFAKVVGGVAEAFMDVVNWVEKAINKVNEFAGKVKGINLNPFSKGFNVPGLSGRASGGPVSPSRSFIVGENGPELFTPSTYGSISNGFGDITVIQNVYGDVSGQELIEKVKRGIMQELKFNAQV